MAGETIITSSNLFTPLLQHQVPVFTQVKSVGFQGIGQTLDGTNPFVFPILSAESSTFSLNPDDNSFSSTNGAQLTLVSGY